MAQYKDVYLLNSNGKIYRTVGLSPVPVNVWENDENGKRRQTDRQQHENGVPVWELDVMVQKISYGSPAAEMVKIRYASKDGSIPGLPTTYDIDTGEAFFDDGKN